MADQIEQPFVCDHANNFPKYCRNSLPHHKILTWKEVLHAKLYQKLFIFQERQMIYISHEWWQVSAKCMNLLHGTQTAYETKNQ